MPDAPTPSARLLARSVPHRLALALLFAGCGSSASSPSSPQDAAAGDGSGAGAMLTEGGMPTSDGSVSDDGAGSTTTDGSSISGDAAPLKSCVPAIPNVAWTSPYAGWSQRHPHRSELLPHRRLAPGLVARDRARAARDQHLRRQQRRDRLDGRERPRDLKQLGHVRHPRAGLRRPREHRRHDRDRPRRLVDDPRRAGQRAASEQRRVRPAGQPVDARHPVQRLQGGGPDAPVYLGAGAGSRLRRLGGARQQPAAPSRATSPASDIVAFDIYPYNNCGGDTNEKATCGQFWLNAFGVDRLHQWSTRQQAVWTDIETTVIAAGTTDGPHPRADGLGGVARAHPRGERHRSTSSTRGSRRSARTGSSPTRRWSRPSRR